ncbi:MerR family transcriptional regulator [Streptomyces sp. NPDC059568]|uniref:DNA polymerase III subunit beta family protein n=1 Tax=Streptomyces sp. NPDC059568 TaxID=3346868 RepID=UPI003686CBD3
MPHSELMPIGLFARRSGLTSSALRFYADSGLLSPAEVDPVSGYRFYSADQVARATVLRQLREIAMPLAAVEAVLDGGADEASRLLDEHVSKVMGDAAAAQQKAAVIKSVLGNVPGLPITALKGPVLADAVEQVLTAAAHEPGMPVLAGLRIEASHEAVILTATDRYRLSTRTLVPAEPPRQTWAGTVDGDELRAAVAEIRRSTLVRLEAVPHGIWLRTADRVDRHCRLLPEEFPDHRLMLASLGEVTTRVTVSKELLLRALEDQPGERIALHTADRGVNVMSADDEHPGVPLPATTAGQDLQIWFELTTLYPAVSTAIGPEVMLDLRGNDQPATIRSADRGDLTTLAMPIKSDHSA